ncbi:uncharacterized protein LOC117320594, partial [Pecten maximus]|uniref:uncharacterized protein LOC117320594 n=1 Tax=Pecten maximus TaxID=6579 RepID=UPI00145876AE
MLIKNSLYARYTVDVVDKSNEDILWVRFRNNIDRDLYLCVCYLPPEGTTRPVDSDKFYGTLLENVYSFQNLGSVCIMGDFNARTGDLSDYIEGVDVVTPRAHIDDGENRLGVAFIDFLVDTNMCMLNGRLGSNDNFTHVSTRGRSVVDYVVVPHEQYTQYTDFKVHIMSSVINQIPNLVADSASDHSILEWVMCTCNSTSGTIEEPGLERKRHIMSTTPHDFLQDDATRDLIQATIDKIDNDLHTSNDVNSAYADFIALVSGEMDKRIKVSCSSGNRRPGGKSRAKPYWNTELQQQWDIVCKCEKEWLCCKHSNSNKRRLKEVYCSERSTFDRLNRKAKRRYQLSEQAKLHDLHKTNSGEMWREIGKLGMANNRMSKIPMEVVIDGSVICDVPGVLRCWKSKYESLYNATPVDSGFDDVHLDNVNRQLQEHNFQSNIDISMLNIPINYEEVRSAVFRANLRKSIGADCIPAEVLRNKACVDMLFKIFSYCFERSVIPSEWSKSIINPIPKPDTQDARDPLSYRGLSILSIPSKIYTDILGVRLNNWLERNNVISDEQNGFRRKRSCLDHLHSLYSIVNNRKLSKLSTFVCFVDARKAFDTVNQKCLWFKLLSIGVSGKMLGAVQALYRDVKCAVRLNNHLSEWFTVSQG